MKADKSYVSEFETRVKSNMEAARSALRTAIEAGDVDAQVKAQEQMATLNADAVRLASLKSQQETEPKVEKQVNVTPHKLNNLLELTLKQKLGQLEIAGLVMTLL